MHDAEGPVWQCLGLQELVQDELHSTAVCCVHSSLMLLSAMLLFPCRDLPGPAKVSSPWLEWRSHSRQTSSH